MEVISKSTDAPADNKPKPPSMAVGDRVNYVPHECHKFDHVVRQGSVVLPWVLGLKTIKHGREEVEELSGIRLTQVLEANKKGQIRKPISELVTIRPAITWDATVTAVYPGDRESSNGYVDLDVHTERGFTLHYPRVVVDEEMVKHHSCHGKDCQQSATMMAPDGQPLSANGAGMDIVAALNEKVRVLQEQLAQYRAAEAEADEAGASK